MAELELEMEASAAPPAQQTRYKWMANILMPARMRGMYLEMLEKVTPDPKIPFVRIVVSLGGLAVVVLGSLYLVTENAARAPYIAGGTIMLAVGLIGLLVVYLINSRGESMIETVFGYNVYKYVQ